MLVALYEPEIPPNTGNIARLCAAFDVELHLIEPLGFSLEDKYLKRAGLDYWPNVRMFVWPDWQSLTRELGERRFVLVSTKAERTLPDFEFKREDALVFGPETRGLPESLLANGAWKVRIPCRRMEAGGVRSLNLSSACAITLYAALCSCGLIGKFA